MQRGSRSWARDDDVKLIEAAIFAKRRSRVPARVDLGKNGPKFYYDNASEQLRYLPADWKQRFNHLLDLYRGDKMTVQLSKMLAAAKDGRLYREKGRGEPVESSDSNDSDGELQQEESEEPLRGAKRRENGKLNGHKNDSESDDLEHSTEAALVSLNGRRNGLYPSKRSKDDLPKDELMGEKPDAEEAAPPVDMEKERDLMRKLAEELASFGDQVAPKSIKADS